MGLPITLANCSVIRSPLRIAAQPAGCCKLLISVHALLLHCSSESALTANLQTPKRKASKALMRNTSAMQQPEIEEARHGHHGQHINRHLNTATSWRVVAQAVSARDAGLGNPWVVNVRTDAVI
jgi:hypothetical protein